MKRLDLGSRNVDFFEAPLRSGLYGFTQLDTFPFRVVVNGNVVGPRRTISLVHELLHVFCRLHKIPLTHEQIHTLAIFIFQEVWPALQRFHT